MALQLSQLDGSVLQGGDYLKGMDLSLPQGPSFTPPDAPDTTLNLIQKVQQSNETAIKMAEKRALVKKLPKGYTEFDVQTLDQANKSGINIDSPEFFDSLTGKYKLGALREFLSGERIVGKEISTRGAGDAGVASAPVGPAGGMAVTPEDREAFAADPANQRRYSPATLEKYASGAIPLPGEVTVNQKMRDWQAAQSPQEYEVDVTASGGRRVTGMRPQRSLSSDEVAANKALLDLQALGKEPPPIIAPNMAGTKEEIIAAQEYTVLSRNVLTADALDRYSATYEEARKAGLVDKFDALVGAVKSTLGVDEVGRIRDGAEAQRQFIGRQLWTLLDLPVGKFVGGADSSGLASGVTQQVNPFTDPKLLDKLMPKLSQGPLTAERLLAIVRAEVIETTKQRASDAIRANLEIPDEVYDLTGLRREVRIKNGEAKWEAVDVAPATPPADATLGPEVTDPDLKAALLNQAKSAEEARAAAGGTFNPARAASTSATATASSPPASPSPGGVGLAGLPISAAMPDALPGALQRGGQYLNVMGRALRQPEWKRHNPGWASPDWDPRTEKNIWGAPIQAR